MDETFLNSSGPLITSSQVYLLDYAVTVEGFRNKSEINLEEKSYLESNNLYKELLLNILIFGPGKFIGKYHYNDPSTELLLKEGLLETVDENEIDNQGYEEKIKKAYELSFDAYRNLENNHFTSPIVSYEEIFIEKARPSNKERQKIEKWLDDIQYCDDIFNKDIKPMINDLSEIFGYYFYQNIDIYEKLFSDMYGHLNHKKKQKRKSKKVFSFDDIITAMGLKIPTAEEYEKFYNSIPFRPGISFSPNNFEDLWVTPNNTPSTYLKNLIDFCFIDDLYDFFFIQSFWRTVFEFQRLLKFSAEKHLPLIMSDDISRNNKKNLIFDNDALGIFKIFLSERISVPKLTSLEDILRLRDDKRIIPLKEIMQDWNNEYNQNNKDLSKLIERIKKDLYLAEKGIKRMDKIKEINRIVGYVCAPISLIPFLGIPITVINIALSGIIDGLSWHQNKKNQWIYWGL